MARGAATGAGLMARAADAVADAVAARHAAPGRAVVVCGPGNNGGDGYGVARRLHMRGWAVRVLALGTPGPASPDAAAERAGWLDCGPVEPFSPEAAPAEADIAVDALFGTGLGRPLAPDLGKTWRRIIAAHATVAVDAPSGLCLDSGQDRGVVAQADLTVTFHAPKLGHVTGAGPACCGRLLVVGIGLGPEDDAAAGPVRARLAAVDPTRLAKATGGHKYSHGHALVLGGGVGRGGAGRLAARAALRIGAGLVTLAVPPAALIENAARLDAVMLRPLADAEALSAALEDRRLRAVVLGPGLGIGDRTRALALAALGARPDPPAVVLDADALTSFAGAPDELFAATHGTSAVMTPHDGEFARLFPDLAGFPDGRPAAVREAALRAGAVVLLKGPDTLIAMPDPDAPIVVNAAVYGREAPWLATAGAGDTLAGLIGGLCARGFASAEAAETAAFLHVEAARHFGPGLVAEDIPESIPLVLRNLGV